MYAQQPTRPLHIPKNYRGTAFTQAEEEPPSEAPVSHSEPQTSPEEAPPIENAEERSVSAPPAHFGLRGLFGRGRGASIGSEELLLIGLCLLLSQSDTKDDLLLLLLLLLLIQ